LKLNSKEELIMVDTGSQNTALVYIASEEEGIVHVAWILPSGEVLVVEYDVDDDYSAHYQLHEHVDAYKEFVSDIAWIADVANKLD
jgi:hypothetical protein